MQFIKEEEEEDRVLKKIEDISTTVVKRKKLENAKINSWPERTVLCLLYFVGQMSEQYTIQSVEMRFLSKLSP